MLYTFGINNLGMMIFIPIFAAKIKTDETENRGNIKGEGQAER